MKANKELNVNGTNIRVISVEGEDYICLTDMANGKNNESRAADIIKNWIRTRYTIEFLGTWELLHNADFKVVEFDHFTKEAGLPSFVLSATEWIERTNALGLIVKKGKYGGTYAQKDIAFEFGSAISVPFKLYLIDEFQRLKAAEQAANPELKGNQRDYASINQLICLSNMENINAVMIGDNIPQPERLMRLNQIAIHQMTILESDVQRKLLK